MVVKIKLYGGIADETGFEEAEVEFEGKLKDLIDNMPMLKDVLMRYGEYGSRYVILVNGRNISFYGGLEYPIGDGDTIKIYPLVSGGSDPLEDVKAAYSIYRGDIKRRIEEFRRVRECGLERILMEMLFCICTPQNRADRCWAAVKKIFLSGIYRDPGPDSILEKLDGIRFRRKKSIYMSKALKMFLEDGLDIYEVLDGDPFIVRHSLAKRIYGFGYKEASHFLRNIGYTFDLAILDRHILRNMLRLRIINEMPRTLTIRRYIELEDRFKWLSNYLGLMPAELDLLLWAMETGYVFK